MRVRAVVLALAVSAALALVVEARQPSTPTVTTWRLDNLTQSSGDALELIGRPSIVSTPIGPAVQFNGVSDGLLIQRNPIQGLAQFTIEVLFSVDEQGPVEQRFLHIQESAGDNRALIELRLNNGRWALDSYLRHGAAQLTLLDLAKAHSADWHVASTTFDGSTMKHYVDGVEQGSGAVAFMPLAAGRTSIGVRQNRVSWFKGRIHTVRISPTALPSSKLMTTPAREIALWPEGVPGRIANPLPEQVIDGRVVNVHDPALVYYPAAPGTSAGTAVIACAGGSYGRLALDNEIQGLVKELTPRGVAVFALKYRVAGYHHPAQLQDVLRAIRTVRSRASEFDVSPDRIGLFGASAGGHLAATAAAWFDAPEGKTGAAIDAVSARPDFVSLLYPVVSMKGPFAHADSKRNLLGAAPSQAVIERLSIESQVRQGMPPFFIVHTFEDRSVPIENSLALVSALRAKKVPVESHFY